MKSGDKVVCVDDDFSSSWADPRDHMDRVPRKGEVFVIRCHARARNGETGIVLIGCNALTSGVVIFYPERFRLLSELKSKANQKQERNHEHTGS